MNIRNNKGITLISLVITIIMLSILAYAAVSASMRISATAKFQNIETYMMLIKSKCETLSNEVVIGEKTESDLYGEDEGGGWYRLSQSDLNQLGVEKAKESDGYYVKYALEEYSSVDVEYRKGIQNDGITYYKLSDIPSATR